MLRPGDAELDGGMQQFKRNQNLVADSARTEHRALLG